MICPSLITIILSQSSIVENLWAIAIDVRFYKIGFKFYKTIFSVSVSSALVASSIKIIYGFLIRHLAKAILCFWPPET